MSYVKRAISNRLKYSLSRLFQSIKLRICIKISNGTLFSLKIRSNETIEGIKKMIWNNNGIPPNQQQLFLNGKLLKNAHSLNKYNIQKDVTLYLKRRLLITPDTNNNIYVDGKVNTLANDYTGNGNSWENAIPQLADALKWARLKIDNQTACWDSSKPLKIYVAQGTYIPLYNAADGRYTATGGRNNAFVLVKDVQIYGGYPSGGGKRDLNMHSTILSGDISALNDSSDKTYHVLVASGVLGEAQLDGVILTEGCADAIDGNITVNGYDINAFDGGGLSCNSSSPMLTNVTICENTACVGAGVSNFDSSLILTNVAIKENTALHYGGGMYNDDYSCPYLINVIISENVAAVGGGMYNDDYSFPCLTNVTISKNKACLKCGGMYNNNSSPQINNSILFGNDAPSSEKNIHNYNKSFPNFEYSLVEGNTSWQPRWGSSLTYNIVTTKSPFFDINNGDYRLKCTSSSVNSGSNSLYTDAGGDLLKDVDLAGNPRLYKRAEATNEIDMGPYEFQQEKMKEMYNFVENISYVTKNMKVAVKAVESIELMPLLLLSEVLICIGLYL